MSNLPHDGLYYAVICISCFAGILFGIVIGWCLCTSYWMKQEQRQWRIRRETAKVYHARTKSDLG